MIYYWSSKSENTHRFVLKLDLPCKRIDDQFVEATEPYILVVPTYGGGYLKGAVPKPVIQFLNLEMNRAFLRAVIAAGNTNFGTAYGIAGNIISQKCHVPLLYKFELLGTSEDVALVRSGVEKFWQTTK